MILSKDKCPNCNERKGFQEVNRIVLTILNSTEFTCQKCNKAFKYVNRNEHYANDCEAYKLRPKCELCQKSAPLFQSKEDIMLHW